MEPFSLGLLICSVFVAMYQMSGTPFLLNIIIFCVILLVCLYAMFVSNYRLPSDALFYWIYSKKTAQDKKDDDDVLFDHHDDQITKKLRELTGHIVRDFILSWYNTVTDDVTFVQEAFELFEHLLTDARARVAQTDKDRLLSNILSEFQKHIVTYRNALKQVDTKGDSGKDEAERRNQLIAVAYCSERPHPALASLPDSEMDYLRGIVILALKGLLPTDYKMNETPLYLVRELIAQNVLNSVVNLMSDPLWIYNTLVEILDEQTEGDKLLEKPDDEETSSNEEISVALSSETAQSLSDNDSCVVAEQNESAETAMSDEDRATTPHENGLSISHSSSITSHFSDDSQDLSGVSISQHEDIPLPLMASEMHFAPEWSEADLDADTVRKRLLSSAVKRAPHEKVFHRIRIPEYTVMKENLDANKKYALYKITFKTKEKIALQQTQPRDIPNSNLTSYRNNQEDSEPRQQEQFVTKRHQVQRRFREFLVLQERLSQNMVAKNLISDVQGPSRMFPVPFGNMDAQYIEQRRKFLQAYLRQICAIPFISSTKEVKGFLAHEMDPRIAYVKKPDSMPRFDKLFKSAIKDLLGSTTMKFTSTGSNTETHHVFQSEHSDTQVDAITTANIFPSGEVSNIGAVAKLKNKVFGFSKHLSNEKASTMNASRKFCNFEGQTCSLSSTWKDEDEIGVMSASVARDAPVGWTIRGLGDGCDAINMTTPDIEPEALPVNLLLKLVPNIWDVTPGRHGLTAVTLTKYIQAYLSEKVAEMTTKRAWTKYLEQLHNALWPEGEWESSKSDRTTWANASDEVKNKVLSRAESCLKSALPDALRYLVSVEEYNLGIRQLLQSLQNTNINRQLIYRFLDLIIFEIFPDLDQVSQYGHVSLSATSPEP